MEQLGASPAGVLEPIPLKKRETAVYWRPMKNGDVVEWIETRPLPSDPINQMKYKAKGFRLIPPSEDPEEKAKDALQAELARLQQENEQLKARQEAPLYVSDKKK